MKINASSKYIRISPRKVRVVVDALRGLNANDALNKLRFTQKRAATPVAKLLESAVANAENNFSLDKDTLKITSFKVDGGPTLKRYKAKGFGRAALIHRKSSHISVVLEGERLTKEKAEKRKKDKTPEVKEPEVLVKEEEKPEEEVKPETKESVAKKDFNVKKKVGRERKPSFVKRIFRRKSI